MGCALLTLAATSHAAFNGISDHSRANCLNNESITWDYTEAHRLVVVSFHTADYMNRMGQYHRHRMQTFWDTTRRAAAVHWGEGKTSAGYYLVQGWHWEYIGKNEILRANTSVDDCSIYNGWWDW
jgi:hypothetical protein